LARLDQGQALMTEISSPIQTMAFGDELAWVFLPGEVVVDYALRLKQELDGRRIWMNAYSNACPGYVPSERILREGGYEGGGAMVYYDIPGPYATGVEQIIVDAVESQLKDKFAPVVDVAKTNGVRPLGAVQALGSLKTKPGYHAELVAAEPLIESPVAIAFGPDAKLWVAEMNDYPQGRAEGESGGQIRCLHDDNGDGRFDRSQVFLTGIPFPTGVTVWRKGVLVCAAPDILYAEDTTGDGTADEVRTLFTGFATHNYQARVNSLEYGLDGWVYGSCGLFGGQITSVQTGQTVALGQRDFRFHPDTGVMEAASGATQQGRVRNDWGDWFGCNNGTMLMHYPLASHYLERNPWLAPSQSVVSIAAGPDPGRLFSVSNQVLFMLSGPPNRPTAACGLGIYRDELLGNGYSQNAFTCEPVNNLVHRQILSSQAATFTSRRDDDEREREFLASTDPWFRPVQVRTGMDGALWVVDMYRYVIEHPIWIPPDTLATLDPRAGSTMGRIYRIVADGQPARSIERLDQLQGPSLAAAMDSPNGTQRDLVQQLLQWRNDSTAAPALQDLAMKSERAEVRVQALSTLANLDRLSTELLLTAFGDPDSQVRRHAVRVSESLLQNSDELSAAVEKLAGDADMTVRLQVAYVAGVMKPENAARTLAQICSAEPVNAHLMSAAESSLTSANIAFVIQNLKTRPGAKNSLDKVLLNAATMGDAASLRQILQDLAAGTQSKQAAPFVRLASFLEASRKRTTPGISFHNPDIVSICEPAMTLAGEVAADEESPLELRIAAVSLLGQGAFLKNSQATLLSQLLTPRTPPELQSAAVAAFSRDGSPDIAKLILDDWGTREPRLRKQSIALLLSRPTWTTELLRAVEAGVVSAAEMELPQQQALLDHADETIRIAAEKSFTPRTTIGRQEAIDRYTAAMHNNGDAGHGRLVFQKHCAGCHRLQELGHVVGPDISGYAGKPVQSLLIAILDPNQAIDPRYQAYVVVLNDGRSVTGLIAEEAASSLTLLAAEGKRETVLRSEVEQILSTGKSLMPEGFELNASTEDVNHLWAFLRSQRIPPKSADGNTPAVVKVPAKGNVALLAAEAEIYGDDITFETPYQNIGYWHGRDDMVRWRLVADETREVAVWGEWACDSGAAGNGFVIEGGQPELKGVVQSTGAWSRYQLVFLGRTLIRAGESEIVMRPAAMPRGAIADLRALHLVRVGGVPLATGMVEDSKPKPVPSTASEIAAWLIDDQNSAADREKLIAAHLKMAGEIIPLMAAGLPEQAGSKEEYRRIPWIWRLAIAAGKSGNNDLIKSVLAASLPQDGQPLQHWQAVVIGGGLINGIGLAGQWPLQELSAIVGDDKSLSRLWLRSLELSTAMADDDNVPTGTRYDALRMVAMRKEPEALAQLERYLQKDVHAELQMGAVSGLSDVPDIKVAALLIKACEYLSGTNRKLAIKALTRDEPRCLAVLEAVSKKRIVADVADADNVKALLQHPSERVRNLAAMVLQ